VAVLIALLVLSNTPIYIIFNWLLKRFVLETTGKDLASSIKLEYNGPPVPFRS